MAPEKHPSHNAPIIIEQPPTPLSHYTTTPISPPRGPRELYAPREVYLPEVNLRNRDAEGLQVDPNGQYPEPMTMTDGESPDSGTRKWAFFGGGKDEAGWRSDQSGLIPADEGRRRKGNGRMCGLRRKAFVIVAVIAIIVIIGAIAGGVGGYEAGKNSQNNDPSATKSYVTSGTTGMAALPCTAATATASNAPAATPNLPNPYLAPGATFNMTCRRNIPANTKNNGSLVTDYRQLVKYTFKGCMDECARDKGCWGVTYGADLTEMLGSGGKGDTGNCALINGTWDAAKPAPTWFASAVKE